MGFLNADPFGSDAYIDELPPLTRKLSPEMVDLMRRARAMDHVARQFIDAIAFGLSMQDVRPVDFAVMLDDVQDLDCDAYEALLGLPPLPAGAVRGPGRRQFKLVFSAVEPGLIIEFNELLRSVDGHLHMVVDGPGAMSKTVSPPPPASRA